MAEFHDERRARTGRARASVWLLGQALQLVWHLRDRETAASPIRSFVGLGADVRHVARRLVRSPGYAAVAVLTLGLGLGATASVFSLAHAIWLKPLPYAAADRLASLQVFQASAGRRSGLTVEEFAVHRDGGAFAELAGYTYGARFARIDGDLVRIVAFGVSPNLFRVLGVRPVLGRDFEPSDTGAPVIMLSDALWRSRFHASPDVVGRSFLLFNQPHTILGVMPPSFRFPATLPSDIWVPVDHAAMLDPTSRFMQAIGRLAPDATVDSASTRVATTQRSMTNSQNQPQWTARVAPLVTVAPGYRTAFGLLLGTVGVFLLMVCANLAGLLIARNVRRQPELRVLMALGAGRWRLTRQLLVECAVLTVGGCLTGLLAAATTMQAVRSLLPADTPRLADAHLSLPVLGVTAFVTAVVAVVSAAVPALSLRSIGPAVVSGTRAAATLRRTLGAMVVVEVVLATVLLVAAVLMVQNFVRLMGLDRGYVPHNVAALNVTLPGFGERYRHPAVRAEAFARILDHVERLPGVLSAGATTGFPGSSLGILGIGLVIPTDHRPDPPVLAALHNASVGYFQTMGVRLESGRVFDDRDRPAGDRIAVINRALAERLWPGRHAVGRRVRLEPDLAGAEVEVIGVVADMRLETEETFDVFVPITQQSAFWIDLVIRTEGDPAAMAGVIRRALRDFDDDLLLENVSTLDAILWDSVGLERAQSLFTAALGVLAAILASWGVSVLLLHDIARQTRELGVRLALGSTPRRLVGYVVMRGLRLYALGVVLGSLVAITVVRAMRGWVSGLEDNVVTACAAAGLLLLAVSLVAAIVPARRVARTDPLSALRST